MEYFGAQPPYGDEADEVDYSIRKSNRERAKRPGVKRTRDQNPERAHERTRRRDVDETFRCRHCRTMVGPVISGGSHRNHCPICLYSLHVDGKTPGDRRSECRSLMEPVGLFSRPSGEQVIIHRCLGCGFERFNRVAADDNVLEIERLERLSAPPDDDESLDGDQD